MQILRYIFLFIGLLSFNFLSSQTECETTYFVTAESQSATCYGEATGQATVGSTGCDCMFSGCQFLWSDGQTFHTAYNLAAGTYSVTVIHTDSCEVTIDVVVEEPQKFVEEVVFENATCTQKGSASVTAAELAGVLTYEWSNGATTPSTNNLDAGEQWVTVTNFVGCTITEYFYIDSESDLETTITTSPTCKGGNTGIATVEVIGGTPPYSIFDTDGNETNLENLNAGNHYFTVVDANSCTKPITFEITETAALEVTSYTEPTCKNIDNGIVSIEVSGGIEPYTYSWLNSEENYQDFSTNVPSGIYNILITDANNCTEEISLEVTESLEILAEVTTQATCKNENGGTASIIVSGGVEPYTFDWGNLTIDGENAENLAAGTYLVGVYDAKNCYTETEFTISEMEAPEVEITCDVEKLCVGETANMFATGGMIYNWSPSIGLSDVNVASPQISPEETTTYTVEVTNEEGCKTSASFTVEVVEMTSPEITASEEVICIGESSNLFAFVGGGGVSYSWYPTEGISNPNSNAVMATPTETTTYEVTATNSNGCVRTGQVTVVVDICSGVSEELTNGEIKVFPNPTNGVINVEFLAEGNDDVVIRVYDLLGSLKNEQVFTRRGTQFKQNLDVSDFVEGVYYLEIEVDGNTFTRKLIKN